MSNVSEQVMKESSSREHSLAPTLLLSMPQLLDPNFQRSVILIGEHGAEGVQVAVGCAHGDPRRRCHRTKPETQ